ncbi:MAG TPA: sialate O-acetylesterase [Planctomycetota bacterium]|nr:sialate O-acetylesterase [Planctomycetota bacterium]
MKAWHRNVAIHAALMLLALAALLHAGQAGKSPIKVFLLAGQSNMEGQAVVDLDHEKYYNGGKGNLEHVMRDPAKAPLYAHLRDKEGKWAARDDVWVWYKAPGGLKKGALSIGYAVYGGRHHFGPELQFGHVIGNALDNQVLLIKTAWGGKSIYKEFRPPSSGGEVGPFYTRMLAEVREALGGLKDCFPDYDGGGYEIAGFVWFQGWNDMCTPPAVPEYEQNLANLIKDVRKELKLPKLPVVIGETGNCNHTVFRKAQGAVAERPELKGTVAFVPTADFLRPAKESPNTGHGHHWFGNAESYFLIGNALGEAMKTLLEAAK